MLAANDNVNPRRSAQPRWAMANKPSVDFTGYWQRHVQEAAN